MPHAQAAFRLADGPVADQFPQAVEVLHGVSLHADLRGKLVFPLQPVGPHDAGFLDANRQRLLHVDVQVAIERPVGNEGVGVVGRAAKHGVNVFLIEALPPVDVGLGVRESLQGVRKPLLVHVAERDHVLVRQHVVMRQAAAPDADQRDVQLVAGGVLARPCAAGQDEQSGSGGGGLQELATMHGWFSGVLRFPVGRLLRRFEQR